MTRLSRWTVAAAVLPPLVIGLAGITHPPHLTADSALFWRNLHIVFLPLLPLLALGPWLVTRALDRTLSWVVLIFGYVYACFYVSLDVLAGIGAGGLKVEHKDGTGVLFGLASDLGQIGSIAFIAATAVGAFSVVRVARSRAIPGALVALIGSYGYMENHVYWPRGVFSMFAIAAGWALMLVALRRAADA